MKRSVLLSGGVFFASFVLIGVLAAVTGFARSAGSAWVESAAAAEWGAGIGFGLMWLGAISGAVLLGLVLWVIGRDLVRRFRS
ncbi:MAG: hypothetical protein ACTJHU_11550 [Mycetocola sp.]